MAEQSFIFLDGVAVKTERKLWDSGIHSWDQFLASKSIPGISPSRKVYFDRQILRAKEYLCKKNVLGLADLFPQNQHWRLYDISCDAYALDIETTGYYGDITVIGLHDGEQPHFLVKNKNLDYEPLVSLFREPRTILTFNGSSFDLPVLVRRFPNISELFAHHVHIDLRHVASKLGFTGGLKTIERIHGITRSEEISGMNGCEAVWLWRQYILEGDEEALATLLEYNEADVKNLFLLADSLIPKLWSQVRTTYKSATT